MAADGVWLASLIAFPITLVIGRIRKGRFLKKLAAEQEAVKQAIYNDTDFAQIAPMIERKKKTAARARSANNLLMLLCLLVILAAGLFNQRNALQLASAVGDLGPALDNAYVHSITMDIQTEGREWIRVYIAYEYFDEDNYRAQLAGLLEQTVTFFEEQGLALNSYNIIATRRPGRSAMSAQWPSLLGDTESFLIRYYRPDGTFQGNAYLPFPYTFDVTAEDLAAALGNPHIQELRRDVRAGMAMNEWMLVYVSYAYFDEENHQRQLGELLERTKVFFEEQGFTFYRYQIFAIHPETVRTAMSAQWPRAQGQTESFSIRYYRPNGLFQRHETPPFPYE